MENGTGHSALGHTWRCGLLKMMLVGIVRGLGLQAREAPKYPTGIALGGRDDYQSLLIPREYAQFQGEWVTKQSTLHRTRGQIYGAQINSHDLHHYIGSHVGGLNVFQREHTLVPSWLSACAQVAERNVAVAQV